MSILTTLNAVLSGWRNKMRKPRISDILHFLQSAILQIVKEIIIRLIHAFHRLFHCNLRKRGLYGGNQATFQRSYPPTVEKPALKEVDFSILT